MTDIGILNALVNMNKTLEQLNDTLKDIHTAISKRGTIADEYPNTPHMAIEIADLICKNSKCETCQYRESATCFEDLVKMVEEANANE